MDKETKRANFEKLRNMMVTKVKELVDDVAPITETDLSDNWVFRWFKIDNKEQLDFLSQFVDNGADYVEKFPTYVCVETDTNEHGYFMEASEKTTGNWMYSLDTCIRETDRFFNRFGYKVTIEKED